MEFAMLIPISPTALTLAVGQTKPRETEFYQQVVGTVDMAAWKHAQVAGIVLIVLTFTIHITCSDFTVLVP